MELRLVEVPVLAVAEALEQRRRHEPAERLDGGAGALGGAHFPERVDDPRGPPIREEDRVAPGLQRPPARRQQRLGCCMPVERVHADEDVEAARPRQRIARQVGVLKGQVRGAARPVVLLACDRDQVAHGVDGHDRVARPRQPQAHVADPAGDVEDLDRPRVVRGGHGPADEPDDLRDHRLVRPESRHDGVVCDAVRHRDHVLQCRAYAHGVSTAHRRDAGHGLRSVWGASL